VLIDFISTKGIQAGIIRLHPGENGTQGSHSVDEVYYVIEGNGFIKLDGKDHQIREGTSIFVPANAEHRFHGNKQDLVIFTHYPCELLLNVSHCIFSNFECVSPIELTDR
jgi:mannose-6-phosphate isomerase-like protein (cupin superfamily)